MYAVHVPVMGAGRLSIENSAARDIRSLPAEYLGRAVVRKPAHHRLASVDGSRITTAVSADRRAA